MVATVAQNLLANILSMLLRAVTFSKSLRQIRFGHCASSVEQHVRSYLEGELSIHQILEHAKVDDCQQLSLAFLPHVGVTGQLVTTVTLFFIIFHRVVPPSLLALA